MTENTFKKKDEHKEKRNKSDLKKLNAIVEARRLYWRILDKCGTFKNSFVPGDEHSTSYNCGMKAVGEWFLAEILDADLCILQQIIREHQSEAKREEIEEEEIVKERDIFNTDIHSQP